MGMENNTENLLREITVLDLADEKASFCSKFLGYMGARVIKIEQPGGDPSRNIGPFIHGIPHPEKSLFFWYHNTNKLGITLNLDHSAGRDIFGKLVRSADIVVETFPPGYLRDIGLDFESLCTINRRIILVSVTGYGQDGPRSNLPSCDLIASAMGGQMYVSGAPSTPPLKPFGEQSYYIASLTAVIGILLALRERRRNARGEHIDISLQEATISTLEHVMIRYFHEYEIPERTGSLTWNNEFCIVPCKDGFILITLFRQWESLVEWLESEGMADDLLDERWNDEQYRLSHLDHIVAVMKRWAQTHTKEELFQMGQGMGFPWAPVSGLREVAESPQLRERGFFVPIDHPELDTTILYPRLPYICTPPMNMKQRRAPLIGEDTARVLQGELGLSNKELQRLARQGTI
jgi:benzylsuccinate CoA-transferase BbsE subunit